MNSTKTKGSKRNAVVAVVLIAALLITGALAFLTAKDSKTNVFTVGKVDLELWENFDSDNDGDPEEYGPETDTPPTFENITPGKEVVKQPYMKNTGKNEAYVFMSVSVPTYDDDGTTKNLFTYTVNEGWKPLKIENGEGVNTYYYYMENPLSVEEGENVTPNLFDTVTFASVDNDFCNSLDDDAELNMVVNAYAIQNEGFVSAADAWNAAAEEFEQPVLSVVTFLNGDNIVGVTPIVDEETIVSVPDGKWIADNGKTITDDSVPVKDLYSYEIAGDARDDGTCPTTVKNPNPVLNLIPETTNKVKLIPKSKGTIDADTNIKTFNKTGGNLVVEDGLTGAQGIVIQRGTTWETYSDMSEAAVPDDVTITTPTDTAANPDTFENYYIFGFDIMESKKYPVLYVGDTQVDNTKRTLEDIEQVLADNYFDVTNGGYFKLESTMTLMRGTVYTGEVIKVYNSDDELQEIFKIIVYGDIRAGGNRVSPINNSAHFLRAANMARMVDRAMGLLNTPEIFAACDINRNGIIDHYDVGAIRFLCYGYGNINQRLGFVTEGSERAYYVLLDIDNCSWRKGENEGPLSIVSNAKYLADILTEDKGIIIGNGGVLNLAATEEVESEQLPILISNDPDKVFLGWALEGSNDILPAEYTVTHDVVLHPVFS